MNITEATKSYEAWLARQTPLLREDLQFKHAEMRRELFSFLRATYYRWAQTFPAKCPDLAHDPMVLAVGDLHVENFGTWRDVEGRLVWGINDFDECYPLPFSHDLVRLAVSADLAIAAGEMMSTAKAAADALVQGYQDCLEVGGKPFVLVDKSTPLRTMARDRLNSPEIFWAKMLSHPLSRSAVPAVVLRAINEQLPERRIQLKFLHRTAGLGSLGKQRFTGVGEWRGGSIVREAKALALSACHWAESRIDRGQIYYELMLHHSVRCLDPMVSVRGAWLIRRLSPDCFRIRLAALPKKRDEENLLYSMGWETANIHLGSGKAANLQRHLQQKSAHWLHTAAKAMRDQTEHDWNRWRERQ
jgi:Uncharacterized protein conserved in bacteria (DUF2252)